MTRNPYAHPVDYGPDYVPEQRTSVMAILSLIFSLICCIPGTGVIGLILGIAAIIAISSSNGRLAGRGAAIAGIIIGALTSVLWLAMTFGATQVLSGLSIYGEAVEDLQAGRTGEARLVFSQSLTNAVTDEQLQEASQRLTAEWGQFQGSPGGLGEWFSAYAAVGQTIQQTQLEAQRSYQDVIPVPVQFSQGTALVWVAIGQTPIRGTTMPEVVNLGHVDRSGQIVWLVDPAAVGGATGGTPPPPPTPPDAGEPAPSEAEPEPEPEPAGG